jgi:hypothetical protein
LEREPKVVQPILEGLVLNGANFGIKQVYISLCGGLAQVF